MPDFEEIYQTYFADVYRYILALSRDAHTAEEAAAHTVVHITQPGTYVLSGTLSAGQIAVDHGVHTHVRSGTVLGPEHRKGEN